MTRRKHVWFARSLLTLIPLAIMAGLAMIPDRAHHHWPLVGKAHNVLEFLGVITVFGVGVVTAAALIIVAIPTLYCSVRYVLLASRGQVDRAVYGLKWWRSPPISHESGIHWIDDDGLEIGPE